MEGSFRDRVRSARDFMVQAPPARPKLPHFLPVRGTVGLLSGPTGIGASWLALEIALSHAIGRDAWRLGMGSGEPGRVLLVQGNDPEAAISHRIHILCADLTAAEHQSAASAMVLPQHGLAPLPLDDLAAGMRTHRHDLLILDRPERCVAEWRPWADPVMPVLLRLEAMLSDIGAACIMVLPGLSWGDDPGHEPPFHAPWRADLAGTDPRGPCDQRSLVLALERSHHAPVQRRLRRGDNGVIRGLAGPRTASVRLAP